MKRSAVFVILALAAGTVLAQYKYTTPDGRTVYSDQPPPSDARNVQQRDFAAGASTFDTTRMPYELRRAAENFPVTLYTSSQCAPCDEGRRFLNQRGVPFTEKTVNSNDDVAYMKSHQLGNSVPVLTVGANTLMQFSAASWGSALDIAGYPKNPAPKGSFTNPAPAAAAPVKAPDTTAGTTRRVVPQTKTPPPNNAQPTSDPANPAGLRF